MIKHAKILKRMLEHVGEDRSGGLNAPPFLPTHTTMESSQDIGTLGEYSETIHDFYMRASSNRLRTMKECLSRITSRPMPSNLPELKSLTKLAYKIRKSNAFKRLVDGNINRSKKSGRSVPRLCDIFERMGQISKFYRAARTLTVFLRKMQRLGKSIKIERVPSERIEVSELNGRTVTQLCQ